MKPSITNWRSIMIAYPTRLILSLTSFASIRTKVMSEYRMIFSVDLHHSEGSGMKVKAVGIWESETGFLFGVETWGKTGGNCFTKSKAIFTVEETKKKRPSAYEKIDKIVDCVIDVKLPKGK